MYIIINKHIFNKLMVRRLLELETPVNLYVLISNRF
jgi:hypothetical protein